MSNSRDEIERGERFPFGNNWRNFLRTLTNERIKEAEKSLADMLGVTNLTGKTFLDIGCGSGLFSLAARNLGGAVVSFDFDDQSVGCAEALKRKYHPEDKNWQIRQGSALDKEFLHTLGTFDIVYSWGVLHHTGKMWDALDNAAIPTKPDGSLFIAIYNDQGALSTFWTWVKKTYCSGWIGKSVIIGLFFPYFFLRAFAKSVLTGKNQWAEYKRSRGMSMLHDWYDWLGGYPFEVASVEAIKNFYVKRNFKLSKLVTTNSWGNNQFVFTKN